MSEEDPEIEDNGDWLAEIDLDDGATVPGLTAVKEGQAKAEPLSPYAVKLDPWGKRKGQDISEIPEFQPMKLAPEDLADMFGMSFNFDPQLVEAEECSDKVKHEFLKALYENPEYQSLHGNTQLDDIASELACLKFGQEYVKLRKKREEQEKKDKADPTGKSPTAQEQMVRDLEAMSAANRASEQAAQEVQEYKDMADSMGIGTGPGSGGKVQPAEMKKMFNQLRKDHTLKQICEEAGKYRLLARSRQRNKVIHGYDDMVGVVMDDEISRMLASELAQMGHKKLRHDAVRRFVEKQMLCRDYRAVKNIAKGPVIFMIDESGSMSGYKIIQAKAMALAMAWVAKQQNRWCGLVGWSDKRNVRWIALPPKDWPTGPLLQWLSHFYGGGTHLPIEKTPEIYEQLGAQRGKTDIVIITDGQTNTHSPDALERFDKWKKEVNAKVIGISILEDSQGLRAISEEFYRISNISVTDEAVGKALSI